MEEHDCNSCCYFYFFGTFDGVWWHIRQYRFCVLYTSLSISVVRFCVVSFTLFIYVYFICAQLKLKSINTHSWQIGMWSACSWQCKRHQTQLMWDIHSRCTHDYFVSAPCVFNNSDRQHIHTQKTYIKTLAHTHRVLCASQKALNKTKIIKINKANKTTKHIIIKIQRFCAKIQTDGDHFFKNINQTANEALAKTFTLTSPNKICDHNNCSCKLCI